MILSPVVPSRAAKLLLEVDKHEPSAPSAQFRAQDWLTVLGCVQEPFRVYKTPSASPSHVMRGLETK